MYAYWSSAENPVNPGVIDGVGVTAGVPVCVCVGVLVGVFVGGIDLLAQPKLIARAKDVMIRDGE